MQHWSDYEEDESHLPWTTIGLAVVAVLALVAVGFLLVRDDDPPENVATSQTSSVAAASSTAPPDLSTTVAPTSTTAAPAATTTVAPSTSAVTATTSEVVASTTTPPVASTSPPAAVSPGSSVGVEPPATAGSTAPAVQQPSYPTLPDGSPAPLIAIFDEDKIVLTGSVPTEEAKARLEELAILNSKFPVPVDSQLTIDPTVPIGIGVRVIELTASRFDPGSAAIKPEHGAEFDRVVTVMGGLPDVTALVIGHADQIGSEDANYKLSSERAAAVVDYMVARGITPSRLASRAVGESDVLTLDNDAASLALNRRTEFVLYGLLDT